MRLLTVLLLAIAIVLFGAPVTADAAPGPHLTVAAAPDSTSQAGYPVVLDGRELFRVQAGIKTHDAEARALATSERLLRLAKDRIAQVDSITVT